MDTALALSSRWLDDAGVPARVQDLVLQDVADRLADLPSALGAAAGLADRVLTALPGGVRRRILGLPGGKEYARLVVSLTAVSYFDAARHAQPIPAQRSASEQVEASA